MKKLLCLGLVLVISVNLIIACGKNDETPINQDTSKSTQTSSDVAKSDDITPTTGNNTPVFYIATNAKTDEESILYHTKDCSLLVSEETEQISQEIVKTIGLRQCSKCKPEKYEGYIE